MFKNRSLSKRQTPLIWSSINSCLSFCKLHKIYCISPIFSADHTSVNNTADDTTAFIVHSSDTGLLKVMVRSRSTHSESSTDSDEAILLDYTLPIMQWVHFGCNLDFHAKTVSLFINGVLIETKRYLLITVTHQLEFGWITGVSINSDGMRLQLAIAEKIFIHKEQWQNLHRSSAIADNKRIIPSLRICVFALPFQVVKHCAKVEHYC